MANDFYQIYRDEVNRLAETMVIKFDVSAIATNRYLTMAGFTVGPDRRTWRYYMNMAGLYHSTNKMMIVQSLDTGEMIEFTTENMAIHRATARGYAYGTSYYKDLLLRHPKQEPLILGILNPVNIEEAIAAPEGTILWMDERLIESNEDNLKELIQADITAMLERWHVEMYSIVDDLYDAGRIIALAPHIPNFIFSARLRNEKTYRTHSFFIRQHLARYGRLDRYMDAMTKDQQLFFYRNVVHFHKYPGHVDSFMWLVDKVMGDRNLPIAEHKLLQNESELIEDLSPKIEFLRHEMTRQFMGVPDTKASIERVTQKQARVATLNPMVEDINISDTYSKMTLSKTSSVQTKVLESSVIDLEDSYQIKVEDLLISNWAYLAKKGQYRALTSFADQKTGEVIQLSALDGFIIFLYAYNRAHGYTLPLVPVITANHIVRDPLPTTMQMYELTSQKLFGLRTAQLIRDMIPEVGTIVSTETFYDTIHAIWKGALEQLDYASVKGHFIGRGEIETMALAMFMDVGVDLADRPGQTFSQWLFDRGLESLEDYTRDEYDAVWSELLSRSTGMELNTTMSLAYIQRAMIGVMERLSSYSVQFIREINEEPLKAIPHKWIRPGDSDGEAEGVGHVRAPFVNEMKGRGNTGSRRDIDIPTTDIKKTDSLAHGDSFYDIAIELQTNGQMYRTSNVLLGTVEPIVPPVSPNVDINGAEVESDIVLEPIYPTGVHIGLALTERYLSGLNLPVLDRWDLDKTILTTDLNGINVSPGAPVLDLEFAIGVDNLHGFIVPQSGNDHIGNALTVKWLSGLNLPV